ncbi:hypothetical protein [Methylobacterium marchantiae]|uniref:Uncharacterized protein n=1 Tax=Methylobacterium marchantiae TaxID=600331 RepID=A0ABW3WZ07_9HYPH|nr:hypothetical protein AIGOOFII_1569 [Methylobacterium marchantiae]
MTNLQTLLAGLVKAALISNDAESLRWREEARRAHAALVSDADAARTLKIDGIWTLAVREAESPEFQAREGRVSFGLPPACPFTLDDLIDPGFDVDLAVERIVGSASTG